jgi:hypothetical protein
MIIILATTKISPHTTLQRETRGGVCAEECGNVVKEKQ